MCIEIHQSDSNCKCSVIRNFVCWNHIDHTHKQTDAASCPDLSYRYVEVKVGVCRGSYRTPCHDISTYAFEHWTDWRHRRSDWEFCERGIDGVHACVESGQFLVTAKHTCGIGGEIKGEWRHLKAPAVKPGAPKAVSTFEVPQAGSSQPETQVEEPANKENTNMAQAPNVKDEVKLSKEGEDADVEMEDDFETLSLEDVKGKGKAMDDSEDDMEKPVLKKAKLDKS